MNHDAITIEAERQIRFLFKPLMPYFDSPDVNEIMVNRRDRVFIEAKGQTQQVPVDLTDDTIMGVIQAIASWNRKLTEPIMDARLTAMRVASVLPPVAVHGPLLSIRKLVTQADSLDNYVKRGDFDPDVTSGSGTQQDHDDERDRLEAAARHGGQGLADLFGWMMRTRKNTVVVGGTSSGKTRLAGAMLRAIPDSHRIITCESPNELILPQSNVVQLETSLAHKIGMRELVKVCLRLAPQRIIIGEVRGAELFDVLDAANTGHPGSLFTVHADSAELAFVRMRKLLRMAPEMAQASDVALNKDLADTLDYIVFQKKLGLRRSPTQVIRVLKKLDANGNIQFAPIYFI